MKEQFEFNWELLSAQELGKGFSLSDDGVGTRASQLIEAGKPRTRRIIIPKTTVYKMDERVASGTHETMCRCKNRPINVVMRE